MVFFVFNLKLVVVDKFELIALDCLFVDLFLSFVDAVGESLPFGFVLLYQVLFLSDFFLKITFESLCLDFTCPAVFAANQNLSLEVVSILAYLSYGHVCLLKDGLESLQSCVGLDSAFLNEGLETLRLILGNLKLFLRSESAVFLFSLFFFVLLFLFFIKFIFLYVGLLHFGKVTLEK